MSPCKNRRSPGLHPRTSAIMSRFDLTAHTNALILMLKIQLKHFTITCLIMPLPAESSIKTQPDNLRLILDMSESQIVIFHIQMKKSKFCGIVLTRALLLI